MIHKASNPLGKFRGGARAVEEPVAAVGHDVENPGGSGGDHRPTHRHRLDESETEGFNVRGKDENVKSGVKLLRPLGRGMPRHSRSKSAYTTEKFRLKSLFRRVPAG